MSAVILIRKVKKLSFLSPKHNLTEKRKKGEKKKREKSHPETHFHHTALGFKAQLVASIMFWKACLLPQCRSILMKYTHMRPHTHTHALNTNQVVRDAVIYHTRAGT